MWAFFSASSCQCSRQPQSLLTDRLRARTSPPKGLFGSGNDRKELEDEIFRLQNKEKESQEQGKPREEPQQEAVNLLIPLAVIVWFEMASTLIDRFRPASSL
eukprot:jgi/Astpho2/8326/Aster-01396